MARKMKQYAVLNREFAVDRHVVYDVAALSESQAIAKAPEAGDLVLRDGDADLTISTKGEWSAKPGTLAGTYQLERPVASAVLQVNHVCAFSRRGAIEAVREMYPDGCVLMYDPDGDRSVGGYAPPDGWDAEEE